MMVMLVMMMMMGMEVRGMLLLLLLMMMALLVLGVIDLAQLGGEITVRVIGAVQRAGMA